MYLKLKEQVQTLSERQKALLDYSILSLEDEVSAFRKQDFMDFYGLQDSYTSSEMSEDVRKLTVLSDEYYEKMKNHRIHLRLTRLFSRVSYKKEILTFHWNQGLLDEIQEMKKHLLLKIQGGLK